MRRLFGSLCLILFVWSLLFPSSAAYAQAAPHPSLRWEDDSSARPPKHRLYYGNITAIRYNPTLGLEDFRLSYRYRFNDDASPLWGDNFIGVGMSPGISPVFFRPGAFVEFQPLRLLVLSAQLEGLRYFGNAGLLQSFANANAEYSDAELSRRGNQKLNYVATGTLLTLSAQLQVRLGPVVLRSLTRGVYVSMGLRQGDSVFYELGYDLLVPKDGWLVTNETDVLVPTKSGFLFGARYHLAHARYDDVQLPPGSANLNSPIQRLGAVFGYTFFNKKPGTTAFNNPTVLLITQWYLAHRYRAGQQRSQGAPYVVLGFAFNGDLWSHGK